MKHGRLMSVLSKKIWGSPGEAERHDGLRLRDQASKGLEWMEKIVCALENVHVLRIGKGWVETGHPSRASFERVEMVSPVLPSRDA